MSNEENQGTPDYAYNPEEELAQQQSQDGELEATEQGSSTGGSEQVTEKPVGSSIDDDYEIANIDEEGDSEENEAAANEHIEGASTQEDTEQQSDEAIATSSADGETAEENTIEPAEQADSEEQQEQSEQSEQQEQSEQHEPSEQSEEPDHPEKAEASQDSPQNEQNETEQPPSEMAIEQDDEDEDYDPEAELVNSETDSSKQTSSHTESVPDTKEEDVDVPLFNDVIKFFISGPLFNNPEFEALTPEAKEELLIAEYNKANNVNVKPKVNFSCTTSYNRPSIRPGESQQVIVPINPFCLRPDITKPMSAEESASYEKYLFDENTSLSSGKWDNFPLGSRLFIGNLAVNTLTKEDVYRIFHPYGDIKQVNMKQGFGFVQFAKAEDCSRAIEGEKNVPLHNKFMHLEVSKHQIQRAMEQQQPKAKNSRGRSRSPEGRNTGKGKVRSRSPISNKTEVKVITTTDSSPSFNSKLLKRLKQDGLALEVEEFSVSAEEVPQESITSAAYEGAVAVIITGEECLNVMVYESAPDGGIRFDEYTSISINAAIDLILSAKAKRFASESRDFPARGRSKHSNSSGSNSQNLNSNRGVKNSNQALYSRAKNGGRHNKYQSQQPYSNNGYGTGSNAVPYNARDNPYTSAGAAQHMPPYTMGNNGGYPVATNSPYPAYNQSPYQAYQQRGPVNPYTQQQQQPPPQQLPQRLPHQHQQQPPPPPPPQQQQPNQAQLLQTMQNMDPNTLQNVLSLMQQFQAPPAQAPQLAPPQAPQQQLPQGNALAGLLGQLQNSVPGASPPTPAYHGASNQFSQPSNSQNLGALNNSNNNQEQTNDLFETLARLKNNM